MKSSYKTVFLLFAICLMNCSFLFAFETPTHEIINEYIVKNDLNGFSLGIYLKNELGFSKGVYEEFESKQTPLKKQETRTVWEWAKKGGKWEDEPVTGIAYARSANHYHNPLTEEGFSGLWGIPFLFPGESAVQWFQEPVGSQYPFGYYSWYDVRDYFYKSLTSSDRITREDSFTDTFRGIGQLMHLVSDMAVPAHTRNDGHYFIRCEVR